MAHRVPEEMKKLNELIGNFIQYWGFKKIHGQIWAYVFLSKDPVDATTLVRRLHVSKALVSLAIKDLLNYDVIQVVGRGDRRKILFQSNPDINSVVINVLRKREKVMLTELREAADRFLKLNIQMNSPMDVNPDRLNEVSQMIDTANMALDYLIGTNLVGIGCETK